MRQLCRNLPRIAIALALFLAASTGARADDLLPATKECQDATLKSAIQFLDSTKPPPVPALDPAGSRTQAVKTLRYLGTPEAAREMARRMTGTVSDWDLAVGLMGSPARSVALEEMKKMLVDPNFPVSGRFLSTMSVLALPDGIVDNIPEDREKIETQFRRELMSALPQKQGAALAVSNNTIIGTAAASSSSLPWGKSTSHNSKRRQLNPRKRSCFSSHREARSNGSSLDKRANKKLLRKCPSSQTSTA